MAWPDSAATITGIFFAAVTPEVGSVVTTAGIEFAATPTPDPPLEATTTVTDLAGTATGTGLAQTMPGIVLGATTTGDKLTKNAVGTDRVQTSTATGVDFATVATGDIG